MTSGSEGKATRQGRCFHCFSFRYAVVLSIASAVLCWQACNLMRCIRETLNDDA